MTSWVQGNPRGAVIGCRAAEQMCSDAPSWVHKADALQLLIMTKDSTPSEIHDLWLFLLMTWEWDHPSWPWRLGPFPLQADCCEHNSLCNMLITILKFLFNSCVKGFAHGGEPAGNYSLTAVSFWATELYSIFLTCWFSRVLWFALTPFSTVCVAATSVFFNSKGFKKCLAS